MNISSRFISNHFVRESADNSSENNSPENSGDSPSSALPKDPKIASSKLRRGAAGKRTISVPIKDIERLRLKGDHISAPPSDSWAWRKYGQKPIKGSPYPRGYYRCSSSKVCPARKQVERSRADPNMLIVTYSCDHNHPPPSSRNIHNRPPPPSAAVSVSEEEMEEEEEEEDDEEEGEQKPRALVRNQSQEFIISDNRFSSIGEGPLVNGGEFGWLADFESGPSIILESPVLMEERSSMEREMAMIFSMREEEEEESDLFADLGELPECSTVFRRGTAQTEAEQRRRSLATTG